MNKFNLTISVLIIGVVGFFAVGIFQKATYKAAEGDSISISYTIIAGDSTYDSQYVSMVIGTDENPIFSDEIVTGLRYGSDFNFETTLTEDVTLTDAESTVITEGTEVSIEAKLTDVVPAANETASDIDSEATSETDSE